jgi:hypothetical protein
MRIKVTIGAFFFAPRYVNVEAERDVFHGREFATFNMQIKALETNTHRLYRVHNLVVVGVNEANGKPKFVIGSRHVL